MAEEWGQWSAWARFEAFGSRQDVVEDVDAIEEAVHDRDQLTNHVRVGLACVHLDRTDLGGVDNAEQSEPVVRVTR